MKLLFTALLCLLLAGCSVSEAETPPAETLPQSLSDSPSAPYSSEVEAVSLPLEQVQRLWVLKDGLLLQNDRELVLLDDRFCQTASRTLDFSPRIVVNGACLGAFDPENSTLVLLDSSLRESRRLQLPSPLLGSPAVSADGLAVFYSVEGGLYRWDLESGIRRRIRSSAREEALVGLHWQDTVLQCRVTEDSGSRELFLDAENGQLLTEISQCTQFCTWDDRYYCGFRGGFVENLVFGTGAGQPMALFPKSAASCQFLPESHGAVSVETHCQTQLTYYALDTGLPWSSLTLEHPVKLIADGGDHRLLLLVEETDRDLLLIWTPEEAATGKSRTDHYYTADAPDQAGLTLCRDYAQRLSEAYGVEVLIGKEAAAASPWDYALTAEHRYPVVLRQLQTLEQCLKRYPSEVLIQTAAHFDSLKLCLVQSVSGISGTPSLQTATGIQFINGQTSHVALAAGPYQEQALYHELYHVMETHILSHSGALDRWNELNPAGFSYDLDHAANARRNSGVYLENGTRAFVDTYSMSFPTEDRARVFEYAMLPDSGHLFQSQIMQRKLQAICTGIREAYALEEYEEDLPWEQYLD